MRLFCSSIKLHCYGSRYPIQFQYSLNEAYDPSDMKMLKNLKLNNMYTATARVYTIDVMKDMWKMTKTGPVI